MGNYQSQLNEIMTATNFSEEEVKRLYKRFVKMDTDQNGTLEKNEFLQLPQIASNPLAQRLLAVFDINGSGDVDFKEFIIGISAFSAKGSKENKLKFAFQVYDIDRDGFISNGELFLVLKMMVGNNLKDSQLQQIVDKTIMQADLDGDGKVSFEEFRKMISGTDIERQMGGVIMDVINAAQARIAEEAGAVAVMALERVPADIRRDGGISRMSDPKMIKEIMEAVTIPVMAKVRIGHFVEAEILQVLKVDFIDESEVLTPADEEHHICKSSFSIPFVCGAKNLGEALRRINEGAVMVRTKGEAGTGNVVEAVRHARCLMSEIRKVSAMDKVELYAYAKNIQAPYDLVAQTAELGRLPVVNFAAGGVATPADAVLMMHLGMDGVFVGSGIFKSGDPVKRAKAIVQAVTHYRDFDLLAQVSEDLGEAMVGIGGVGEPKFAERGW